MIYFINESLLEKGTPTARSKSEFTHNSFQSDIFTLTGGQQEKKSRPLVRIYLDDENEINSLDELDTRIKATIKTNNAGKKIIHVNAARCGAKDNSDAVIVAVPFEGSCVDVQFAEGTTPLKGVVKILDPFVHNGETYTRIVYLIAKVNTIQDFSCTIKYDIVKKTGDDSFNVTTKSIKVNGKDVEAPLAIGSSNGINGESLHKQYPKVNFTEMMNAMCIPNAEEPHAASDKVALGSKGRYSHKNMRNPSESK